MRRAAIKTTVGAAAVAAAIAASALSASAVPTACPPFSVLHNDRIGSVSFPAGPYSVTDLKGVTCQQSAQLFAQFLQDWDGKLPGGWALKQVGANRIFYSKGGKGFTATPTKTPTPAPGPTPQPSSLTCPGSFQVLHDDRVGAMILPKGNYRISRLTQNQRLTCPQATASFAYFLNHDYSGVLPAPWTMNAAAKIFFDGSGTNGFSVLRLSGLTTLMGSNPRWGNSICTTNFRVGSASNVAGVRIRAGRYILIATGNSTCSRATQLATRTINNSQLPAGWTVAKSIAWFHAVGSHYGFQLDPGAFRSGASFTG